MLKRLLFALVATLFFVFQFNISNVNAVELDENIRTVKLNDQGEEIVLSLKQVKQGQRIFVDSCTYCHKAGATKTNPNVNLGLNSLANAEPRRDNVAGIVDYLKNPTTYDGEKEIYEFHPNTTRSDLYPLMRNLTDDDLEAVAGYILIQPEIRGILWGGGKVYN
ncbi:MAG: photosystem II cytochrome c-550 [Pleurocapsa sp.]